MQFTDCRLDTPGIEGKVEKSRWEMGSLESQGLKNEGGEEGDGPSRVGKC